jgi:hypothetical protein
MSDTTHDVLSHRRNQCSFVAMVFSERDAGADVHPGRRCAASRLIAMMCFKGLGWVMDVTDATTTTISRAASFAARIRDPRASLDRMEQDG